MIAFMAPSDIEEELAAWIKVFRDYHEFQDDPDEETNQQPDQQEMVTTIANLASVLADQEGFESTEQVKTWLVDRMNDDEVSDAKIAQLLYKHVETLFEALKIVTSTTTIEGQEMISSIAKIEADDIRNLNSRLCTYIKSPGTQSSPEDGGSVGSPWPFVSLVTYVAILQGLLQN